MAQWQVAIDVGTSNAVVALRGPDGRLGPVPFGDGTVFSTGVFADAGGRLLTGPEAEQGGRRAPERFEPHPKWRIDDGRVLLGDRDFEVSWLIGAVLARAYGAACRLAGGRVPAVVLPFPVGWGQRRRAILTASASVARLPPVRLMPEPVAAAAYFISARGVPVPVGRHVLVYDLGAGTFEATVLRREAAGFAVVATEGLRDLGGDDIDAAIVAYLRRQVRPDDEAWKRLSQPGSLEDAEAARALWSRIREAKQRLSRSSSTVVHLPLLEREAPLGREQFEELARPILERTITVATSVLAAAKVPPGQLAGVFPVDGSSRIPLVSTLLHRSLTVAPVSVEQPHLTVALGALLTDYPGVGSPTSPGGAPVSGGPVSGGPVSGGPVSGSPVSGGRMPGSVPISPASGPPVPGGPGPRNPVPLRPGQVPPRPGRAPVRPGQAPPRPGQAPPPGYGNGRTGR